MKPRLRSGLQAASPGFAVAIIGALIASHLAQILGIPRWIVWIIFGFIGMLVAGLVFWILEKRRAAREISKRPAIEEDLHARLAEANRTLEAAKRPGLRDLPVILVLGPPESAKSSSIVGSRINAEQLTGDVFRKGQIPPTKSINAWYTDGTVFLEAGGTFGDDASLLGQLVRKILPRRLLSAIFRGRPQAPRAVLVCLSCEDLLRTAAEDACRARGQALRSGIIEASQLLGVRLPVYVLFTKADQIPSFSAYCSKMEDGGAGQVLGATLPIPGDFEVATYADRQNRVLGQELRQLARSLALKRLKFLSPDQPAEETVGAYELPRELKKLSKAATAFLIELCKPSQLKVSPFLRGFYFVGRTHEAGEPIREVRPTTPTDFAPAGATDVFDPSKLASSATASPTYETVQGGIRYQWLFLSRVFREILLRDPIAAGVMRVGQRISIGRRLLLGAFTVAVILMLFPLVASFLNNRNLQAEAEEAVRVLNAAEAELPPPSRPHLMALDSLRRVIDTIEVLEEKGPYSRDRGFNLASSRSTAVTSTRSTSIPRFEPSRGGSGAFRAPLGQRTTTRRPMANSRPTS
jgi:type VI secretion system protein ImpL